MSLISHYCTWGFHAWQGYPCLTRVSMHVPSMVFLHALLKGYNDKLWNSVADNKVQWRSFSMCLVTYFHYNLIDLIVKILFHGALHTEVLMRANQYGSLVCPRRLLSKISGNSWTYRNRFSNISSAGHQNVCGSIQPKWCQMNIIDLHWN